MVSPPSIATMRTLRLPLPISPPLFSAVDTSDRSFPSLPTHDEHARGPGPCSAGTDLSGLSFRGGRRLSQLPVSPPYRFAVLSDSGRTFAPNQGGASAWSPLSQARGLPQSTLFRSSITRLHGSLPTLEDAVSGRRPRLASGGGSSLAGQVSHLRGLDRDFPLLLRCLYSLFLFPFVSVPSRLYGLWLAPGA